MTFKFEMNQRGDYCIGINVEYSHDQKCVMFQFELVACNVVIGYQWGQKTKTSATI